MSLDHLTKSINLADKITSMASDGLGPLERTIASWPAEFRAIVWDAVALLAQAHAKNARGDQ